MENLSIERVVTLFTPLFSAIAAWIVGLVGQAVPGVNLSAGDVTALEIAGATAAAAAAIHWLHGRQKFVQFESDTDQVVRRVADAIKANQPAAIAVADVERVVKSHTDEIVDAIGKAVHAPPSAEEVAKQIIAEAAGHPAPAAPAPQSAVSTGA